MTKDPLDLPIAENQRLGLSSLKGVSKPASSNLRSTEGAAPRPLVVDWQIHDIHNDATLRRSRALLFAFLFTKVKLKLNTKSTYGEKAKLIDGVIFPFVSIPAITPDIAAVVDVFHLEISDEIPAFEVKATVKTKV